MKKNVITWFDIPANNLDRAVKFYSDILGEEVRVDEMEGQKLGFFQMDKDDGVGGDITPSSEDFKPSPLGVRVYLNCDGKLSEVLSRVRPSGGAVIKERYDIGDWGQIAVIMDTEGNYIGLHSSK